MRIPILASCFKILELTDPLPSWLFKARTGYFNEHIAQRRAVFSPRGQRLILGTSVDQIFVLTMDLGGSTTYTLTCMDSTVPIPDPEQSQTAAESETPQMTAQPEPTQPALDPPVQQQAPMWPVTIFVAGLAAAGGAFVTLQIAKRRQQDYDFWEDDEEE